VIAIWLKDPDTTRAQNSGFRNDLIVVDPVGFLHHAIETGMYKREVGGVDEILDRTEGVGAKRIGAGVEYAVSGVSEFREWRNVMSRVAERRPNKPIPLLHAMWEGARLEWWRRFRLGGDQYALGIAVITPTVIGANHGSVDNPSFGKLCAPMDTEIFPDMNFAAVSPNDEVLPEQFRGNDLALIYIFRERDDMPIIGETGIGFSHFVWLTGPTSVA
jgi:hypothetical protein